MLPVDPVIKEIQSWIESFIIGLDICPFAAGVADNTLYIHHKETHHITIANQVFEAINKMRANEDYQTSLIIIPRTRITFEDFYDLSQVLQEQVDERWPEEYVLVAFHQDFRYDGEREDNIVNAVNRSPHPMLHILTSESLDAATEDRKISEQITKSNITKLRKLSWQALFSRYGVKYSQRF